MSTPVPLCVVLATGNPGKAREVRAIFGSLGVPIEIEVLPMWLGEVETGTTYLENARLKAQAAARTTGQPALAEDSGLEVAALGGAPGVRSARFAGPKAADDRNVAKLLRLLESTRDRRARYRAVAVLRFPSGREVVGEGTLEGSIAPAPRGSGGFGYDPVFVPEGEEATVAELAPQSKDTISHRGRALRALALELFGA